MVGLQFNEKKSMINTAIVYVGVPRYVAHMSLEAIKRG